MEKHILTPESEELEMLHYLNEGKLKGTTTYIKDFDDAWTWRPKEVTLVTGMANEGKSTYLKQLALIKALEEDKHFIFYSPEDYPASEFFDDMIHTLTGKSTDKTNINCISEIEYKKTLELLKKKFYFLYIPSPQNTIENICRTTEELIKTDDKIYGLIIDPYIKMTRSRLAPDRDDLYGSYIMNMLGDLTKLTNICALLVMHQQTPQVTATGNYAKPNKYTIKSGGTFSDTADNVLFLWRPRYATDPIDPETVVGSLKIKKQKLVGVPRDITISFDRKSNRFCHKDSLIPLYNWDKWIYNT